MNRNIAYVLTAIGAAAAGTATAMLLAPRKGKTTRNKLKKQVKKLEREVKSLTGEARKQKKTRKKTKETIARKKNTKHHVYPGEVSKSKSNGKDLEATAAKTSASQTTLKNKSNL